MTLASAMLLSREHRCPGPSPRDIILAGGPTKIEVGGHISISLNAARANTASPHRRSITDWSRNGLSTASSGDGSTPG